MNIGEQIAKLRMEQNMTQEALAEKLGVSRQAVTKWESSASTPDVSKLVQIADLFQVSLDRLVGRGDTLYDKLRDRIETISAGAPFNKDVEFLPTAHRFIKYMEGLGISPEIIVNGLVYMCTEDPDAIK